VPDLESVVTVELNATYERGVAFSTLSRFDNRVE